MESTDLMEFKQDNPDYYMCKTCRTHIALAEDYICHHMENGQVHGIVVDKVVNVQVDESVQNFGPHTVADIYCLKCSHMLGWKYIHVDWDVINISNGNLEIMSKKILRRQADQILDAEWLAPLPENPQQTLGVERKTD